MCRALHIPRAVGPKSPVDFGAACALLGEEAGSNGMRALENNPIVRRRVLSAASGALGASLILSGYELANWDQAHAPLGGPLMLLGMIGIAASFVAAVTPIEPS